MLWRSLVALTVVVSLLPASAAAANLQDPLAETAASEPGEIPTEGPAEAPATAAPVVIAPPPPTVIEPEYSGKGLLGAAIGLTALSWVSRFTSLALLTSNNACTSEGCGGKVTAGIALLYVAPISQFFATGLVIPGALMKGRHDGWRSITTGKPQRKAKSFVVAGGVMFGVFTALSIALRPVYIASIVNCVGNNLEGSSSNCGGVGGVVGYNIGVAVSDTGSTVGAGLMSYGIGYRGYTRRNGPRVSVAPFNSRGAYGLSLGGSF